MQSVALLWINILAVTKMYSGQIRALWHEYAGILLFCILCRQHGQRAVVTTHGINKTKQSKLSKYDTSSFALH